VTLNLMWHSISSLNDISLCLQGEVYFTDLAIVGSCYNVCLQHVGYYHNLVNLKKCYHITYFIHRF